MKHPKKILIALTILGILILSGCGSFSEGKASTQSCRLKPRDIPYSLGSTQDSGKGILNANIKVPLTNKADIGALFKVLIDCKTLEKSETLTSKPMYIPAGEKYTFNLDFKSGLANSWQCNNYRVRYEGGNECILR